MNSTCWPGAAKAPFPHGDEPVLELKPSHFHTPDIVAMEDQARAFKDADHDGLPLDHASKFYLLRAANAGSEWDIGLVLRSDHEPNLVKLRNAIGASAL